MNPYELEERLLIARRLRRDGVPLYIPEDDETTDHLKTVGLHLKCLYGSAIQLNEHYFGVSISARIISNRSVPFYIDGYDLELPWKPQTYWILSDPAEEYPARNEYTFWGFSLAGR